MRLMELYECGCYNGETCALSREIANCVHYDKCMCGQKPPKLVMDGDEGYITDVI
jgi:hypothetical protein